MDVAGVADPVTLSVIVPVYNGGRLLATCLEQLFLSDYRDFEVIVVDDGSTDQSGDAARHFDVRCTRMPSRSGPAAARNAGAAMARGEYLVFLDADVLVHADTLALLVQSFADDPAIDAVFGSYDTHPTAPNFISNYKNLFHHHVHQVSHHHACTFWSGCGAMKRSVFIAIGGFDPTFRRPTVEDIELGMRLDRAGHRITLNRKVRVTHTKYWGFLDMIRSDVFDRAIPWTRLILSEKSIPNDLNLNWPQRISAALTFGLLVVFTLGCIRYPLMLAIPFLLLSLVLIVDYWSARRRIPTAVRWAGVGTMLAVVSVASLFLPDLALISLLLTTGIVALNFGFYAFFFRERNPLFGVAIFPLHLLYYVYSGLVFGLVSGWHLLRPGSLSRAGRCLI